MSLPITTDAKLYKTRVGQFSVSNLIPETFTGIALFGSAWVSSSLVAQQIGLGVIPAYGLGFGIAVAAALARQFETRQARKGCVLTESNFRIYEPWEPEARVNEEPEESTSVIDAEMTAALQKVTKDESLFVEVRYSAQFKILIVRNDNPHALGNERVIAALAIKAGLTEDEVKFIPVYGKEQSAYLVPRPESEWVDIPYSKAHLKEGELIGFLGKDINDQAITYSRRKIPHAIFAGTTNSGKTEGLRVDIQSMLDSDTNPIIYVCDPKDDLADLKPIIEKTGGKYVTDIQSIIELMEQLSKEAEARKKRYASIGTEKGLLIRNIWDYRKLVSKTDNDSRPILLYADELTAIMKGIASLNKSVTDPDTKQTTPGLADRASDVVGQILRRDRAAGLFFTGGIQRPDANIVDGEFKANIGLIVAFSHINRTSSQVTLDTIDAVGLPMFGGMVVKMVGNRRLTYGRSAYLGEA